MDWFKDMDMVELGMLIGACGMVALVGYFFVWLGIKINQFFRGLGFKDSDDG